MGNFIPSLGTLFKRPPKYKIQSPPITACNQQVFLCGNVIEKTEYERPLLRGLSSKRVGRSVSASEKDKKINRNKVLARNCRTVRQYANANPGCNKFVTLTFSDNLTDIDEANYHLKKFNQRVKYRYPDFKYIVVIEFQKRGAVHYHMLCNLPYIDVNELARIWGHGFIKLNKIDNVDNVGAYVTKYMQKDLDDPRLRGRKCYMTSRNLNKPLKINNHSVVDELLVYICENDLVLRSHTNTTYNEYFGQCTYTQIVLKEPVDFSLWRKKRNRALLLSRRLKPVRDIPLPLVQMSLCPLRAGAKKPFISTFVGVGRWLD